MFPPNVEETLQRFQRFAVKKFNADENNARVRIARDEKKRNLLSDDFTDITMKRIAEMSSLSNKVHDFDHQNIVELTINEVMQKIGFEDSKTHIHWAPTQSGKTAFKTVKIMVYLTMNIPVVVITKGKSESIELKSKISSYLKHSKMEFHKRIFSAYEKDIEELHESFENAEEACVLIIPDTHQKIEYAHRLLCDAMKQRTKNSGCALILDEVDAIIDRSEDQDEKNEKAMDKLVTGRKPSLVMVTATPIPVFMKHLDKKPIITTSHKSIENYVGEKNMKLTDQLDEESLNEGFGEGVGKNPPNYEYEDGKKCKKHALFPGDKLQHRKKFPVVWAKKNPEIPRMNSQVIKFFRREMDMKNAKGLLALTDTCPWVDADKNLCLFHQASGIQEYFFSKGKDLISIVVHRELVFYRLPGHKYGFECKMPLGVLIDAIDKKYGLKMPVFVFGYYAMKRSRSFRSSQRVPTCMVMCLGKGQSNENCRQAAGRATFKGLDVLLRNRKTDKVKMLCPQRDFDIIQKYDLLVQEIIKLYNESDMMWKDIVSTLSSSSENYFLEDSARRTGNYIPGRAKKGRNRNSNGWRPKAVDKIGDDENSSTASTLSDHALAERNITSESTLDEDIEGSPDAVISHTITESESAETSSANSSLAPVPKKTAKSTVIDKSALEQFRGLKNCFKKTPVTSVHLSSPTEEIVLGDENNIRQSETLSSGSSDCSSTEGLPDLNSTPTQDIPRSSDDQKPAQVVAKLEDDSGLEMSNGNSNEKYNDIEEMPIKTEKLWGKKRKYDDMILTTINNGIIDLVDGSEEEDAIDLTIDDASELL